MKKQYIAPEFTTVNHTTQQMLAVSLKNGGDLNNETADSDRMEEPDFEWEDWED